MKKYLFVIFLAAILCQYYPGLSQVVVSPASGGTMICTNKAVGGSAPGFTVLDTIMIRETHANDFAAGNDTLVLKPPTGWKFWTGATPTINFSPALSGDFLTESLVYTQDSILLAISVTAASTLDTQWIIGIQVQAQSTTAAPGYIYASRIAGGIAGITPGSTGTDFGDLSLSPSAIWGSNTVCLDGATTLSDSSAGGTWSTSNGLVAGVDPLTGVVTGISVGVDTIIYTLPGLCKVTYPIPVVICEAGAPQVSPSDNEKITLFPNPAIDELTITIARGAYHSFTICNILGARVVQEIITGAVTNVDLGNLQPGMYLISFQGDAGNVLHRFVKR